MLIAGIRALMLSITVLLWSLGIGMLAFDTQGQEQKNVSESANTMTITSAYLSIPEFVQTHIPTARMVGQSRLKMYFFKIYDATLYAPNGQFDQTQPFALSLGYLRDFDGADIAQRSIDEMRDLGYRDTAQLAQWLIQMELSFPNIIAGDVLTGVVDEQQHTRFYFNGKPTHTVADPEFTQAFFAIWLDSKTSQPKMRIQLLGETK
ncbi:chalcone isomerase family protein [Glaciecola sp.]|jgi:hypothetical protein|nr:chalcone isomerase family protein [Glaciecola sp.]